METLVNSGCKDHVPSGLVVGTAVMFFAFLDLLLRQVQINQRLESAEKWTELSTLTDCSEQSKTKTSHNSSKKDLHYKDSQEERLWKLRNIILSWIHALISGPIAIVCVFLHPAMIDDVIGTCSPLALGLVCFSLGYFIHDSIHMARYKLTAETKELLLHHSIIFATYGIAVATRAFVAYAVASLFFEVNSIFLHARQLANMRRLAKASYGYRFISVANIVTFLVFRVLTTVWMSYWLVANWRQVPIAMALLGTFGLIVIGVMNTVLLIRLVRSDFIPRASRTAVHAKDS